MAASDNMLFNFVNGYDVKGQSPYDMWKDLGYEGGSEEFIEFLCGNDGITPHIGENGNWFVGDLDTGCPSKGDRGPQGVSISKIEQTTVSTEDGGTNVVTVSLSDGGVFDFEVTNGNAISALESAKEYTDDKVTELIDGETNLTTFALVSSEIGKMDASISGLRDVVNTKASSSDLSTHEKRSDIHISPAERSAWNNAQPNQNAFSNVVAGGVTISADNATDTLTLQAGPNITISGDASSDKVIISAPTYTLSSFGVTASATELNYVDGVTSNIQTQLNGKASSSHTHSAYYDSSISRTANTVLAAPNGSAGKATFRKLVVADLPTGTTASTVALGNHTHSGYATSSHTHTGYLATSGGTMTGTLVCKGSLDCRSTFYAGLNIEMANNYSYRCKNTSGSNRSALTMDKSNNFIFGSGACTKLMIGSSSNTPKTEIYSAGRIDFLAGGVASGGSHYISITSTTGSGVVFPSLHPSINGYIALGTSSYRWSSLYATSSTINTSDRRLKDDIKDLDDRYIKLYDLLSAKSYYLKTDHLHPDNRQLGFIAQDVEDALLSVGLTFEECGFIHKDWADRDDYQGYEYGLSYDAFTVLAQAKIKKQDERINALEEKLEQLASLIS